MLNSKLLKSYKGYSMEKSWEEKPDGTIDKNTVIYTAYDEDDALIDADKILSDLKRKIDAYKQL